MFTLFVQDEHTLNWIEYGCYEADNEGLKRFRQYAQKYCCWNGYYYLRPDTDKARKFLIEHNEI